MYVYKETILFIIDAGYKKTYLWNINILRECGTRRKNEIDEWLMENDWKSSSLRASFARLYYSIRLSLSSERTYDCADAVIGLRSLHETHRRHIISTWAANYGRLVLTPGIIAAIDR